MHAFEHDFYGHDMSVLVLGYIRPELDYVSKGMSLSRNGHAHHVLRAIGDTLSRPPCPPCPPRPPRPPVPSFVALVVSSTRPLTTLVIVLALSPPSHPDPSSHSISYPITFSNPTPPRLPGATPIPSTDHPPEALIDDINTDVAVALNSLARPAYAACAADPFLTGPPGGHQPA